MTKDPSMYSGSPGVLLGMYRYMVLLKHEQPTYEPFWIHEDIAMALKQNLDISNEVSNDYR